MSLNECLIIPCSDKKVKDSGGPMPAIELFDGVYARLIRKRTPGVDTYILSAKYGLIDVMTPVEPYDIEPADVINKEWVTKNVIRRWVKLTGGNVRKYENIWHITRGATFKAIQPLSHFGDLRCVVPDDAEKGYNIGVRLHYLKEFCVARPPFSNIDVDAIMREELGDDFNSHTGQDR